MALYKVVKKNVALNKVAQAVALEVMKSKAATLLIQVYGYETGRNCGAEILEMASMLSIVLLTLERTGGTSVVGYNTMRGSMSALQAMSGNGFRWRSSDAVAVHMGVENAIRILPSLSPREVQKSWSDLNK